MYRALPDKVPEGLNIGLLLGFPCRKDTLVTPEMVIALASQPMPTNMNVAYLCLKGKPIEEARDLCADNALELGAKYLWFVDDDVVPPPNTVRRLINVLEQHPEVMVCGGVYCLKAEPTSPIVFRGNGHGSFWQWKVGEIFEVTGMGAGCMMINTAVFKKLEKPYFPWIIPPAEGEGAGGNEISEDLSFCNKVRAAGYRVVAHGGVLCDHFDVKTGKTYRLPENSFPYTAETLSADIVQQNSEKEKG